MRQWVECDECGGEGHYDVDTTDARYEHTTRRVTCPACEGEGERFLIVDEDEEEVAA